MKIDINSLQNKANEKKIMNKSPLDSSFQTVFQDVAHKENMESASVVAIDSISPLLMQRTYLPKDVVMHDNPMDSIESVMVSLARYSEDVALAKEKVISLASLHEHLIGIENSIIAIKDTYQNEVEDEPLKGLLHSVEILVLTEKYKMNRGDYL